MAMSFARVMPRLGRPVDPDDATRVPSSSELSIHSVAATSVLLAVSGFVLCIGVVACFWNTVPLWLLLSWGIITTIALLPAPLLLHGADQRVLSDADAKM